MKYTFEIKLKAVKAIKKGIVIKETGMMGTWNDGDGVIYPNNR